MKRLRMLHRLLKQTGTYKIWIGFVVFVLICSVVVWIAEPGIKSLGDGFWYCYAVVTTIGFGDIIAVTMPIRILSVFLSIYAALVIAVVTGVVISFYNQIIELRRTESIAAFADRLEHLPELSKEELKEMSAKVKSFMDGKRAAKRKDHGQASGRDL